MTATFCEAPAFRLRDATLAVDPRLDAVEEILQLRHDIDDHRVALVLLRGVRPDLDELAIEGAIEELIDLAADVHRAESNPGDWCRRRDLYESQLRAFAYGGPR